MERNELYRTIGIAAVGLADMNGNFLGLIGEAEDGTTLLFMEQTLPPEKLAKALKGLAKMAEEYLKSLPAINNSPGNPHQN